MRKLIVNESMSLDGVVQGPGDPDEDRSGGFEHGGLHQRYVDDLSQKQALESTVVAGGFLLGRRTYDALRAGRVLVAHGLVDEFRVMIGPVVVGGDKRLFSDDGALRPLRLLDRGFSRDPAG